jgi:hypothetical protein
MKIDATNLKPKQSEQGGFSPNQLVGAIELLEVLFPEKSRPTLRWLRDQCKQRRVPYRKIGHLVFFDPDEVLETWRNRQTVNVRGGVR